MAGSEQEEQDNLAADSFLPAVGGTRGGRPCLDVSTQR